MRSGNRTILAFIVLVMDFALIVSAGTAQQDAGKPKSTWDLVRKAQTQKSDSVEKPEAVRVIHFPKERSIGRLMIGDENPGERPTPFGYPFEQIRWEYFGHARGDVKVPMGKLVHLILFSWTWQNYENLSALRQLEPDDIYSLTLSPVWSLGGSSPDDNCMPYVAHLTGLKNLNLDGANITTRGLKYLNQLNSLERLKPPTDLSDSGMILIGKLKSLKVLYIYENNNVTNEGLKQLSNLKSLELLVLSSVRMTDEGLTVLSDLPLLNNLILDGHFTNDAILHLKDIDSLRTLTVGIGGMSRVDNRPILMQTFNDKGMQNISGLTQLEHINVHWIEGITDRGVIYLKDMPSLKSLDIGHAKLADRAILNLKQMESLEFLILPSVTFTDESLKHVTALKNLRYLTIGIGSNSTLTQESLSCISCLQNLESLSMGWSGLGDEGMKHIAKLTNLNRLSISRAKQLTNKGLTELTALLLLRDLQLGKDTQISIAGLKSLNNLKNLKSLIVKDIHQDNSVLDISGLQNLERFRLSLCYEKKGASMISESFQDKDLECLSKLTRLEDLTLAGFGISDVGMRNLSELNNLVYLNILCPGETRITDISLKYFTNMQKLYDLEIKDGHFTDNALDYINNLPSLYRLELTSDYAFNNQAVREFKQKNPDITKLQLMP